VEPSVLDDPTPNEKVESEDIMSTSLANSPIHDRDANIVSVSSPHEKTVPQAMDSQKNSLEKLAMGNLIENEVQSPSSGGGQPHQSPGPRRRKRRARNNRRCKRRANGEVSDYYNRMPSASDEESSSNASRSSTIANKGHIRPPPGLAPPPGFETGATEDTSNVNELAEPSSPLALDGSLFVPQTIVRDFNVAEQPSLLNTLLEEQGGNVLSPMHSNKPERDLLDSTPLLGLSKPPQTQDINVMNLLSLLDDAVNQHHNNGDESHPTQEDNIYEPLSPLPLSYGFSTSGISSNPWAYGFELEPENARPKDGNDSSLFTSSLLGVGRENNVTENELEKEEENNFDADAFFKGMFE